MQLVFEQIRSGGDRNFGYLLGDRDARMAVLIDPSYSPQVFVDRARAQNLTVTHVVNTHGHPDHLNGNEAVVAMTAAKVAAHPRCPTPLDVKLGDEQELRVGALRLRCLYVPGHADDHIVVYEPTYKILITGDLLFVGKVGGTRSEDETRAEWEQPATAAHRYPGRRDGVARTRLRRATQFDARARARDESVPPLPRSRRVRADEGGLARPEEGTRSQVATIARLLPSLARRAPALFRARRTRVARWCP
jgi:hydroxyacylglutathione hydrolase